MIHDDMWVLCRLTTQEKLDKNNFECCLVLEYKDKSSAKCIDINAIKNHNKTWLSLVRKESPFSNFSDTDIPIKDNLSLFISCFIDVYTLLEEQPQLEYIYLLASSKHEQIHLETVYPLSQLKEIEPRNLNRIFVQMYPKIPSERYEELEDKDLDSENWSGLLALIQGKIEQAIVTEAPIPIKKPKVTKKPKPDQDIKVVKKLVVTQEVIATKEPIMEAKNSQDTFSIATSSDDTRLEILGTENADVIWGIFSKQDLDDLVEGFKDWERVHGKNTLLARLPKSLADKIGGEFEVVFWTSGQGISNMVVDDRPPRHTMVMGLVKTIANDTSYGIGYCIQRPTSLDKVWNHQKWHSLECENNDILRVTTANF
jgi:hypothetical protein